MKVEPQDYDNMSQPERAKLRNKYVEAQQGMCWYCNTPLNTRPDKTKIPHINIRLFPDRFFKYPIHLHHSRVTGLTVGAVHAECNAILWQYHGE
jgi:hypothetical protein